ncbi:MAG: hypothetical protein ACOCQI_06675 [Desulfosalsimonas sp.]
MNDLKNRYNTNINFVVHRYEHVNNEILAGMVNQRLGDFEQFRNEVMDYVRKTADGR